MSNLEQLEKVLTAVRENRMTIESMNIVSHCKHAKPVSGVIHSTPSKRSTVTITLWENSTIQGRGKDAI